MGSIDEINNTAINASVGGLVWVRRRNGSWWPGRIMAHNEVPDNTIVCPKSGTPIKLLGREDASVDWYNLEKSKRVKAFRCGEYDACIETAKNTAWGNGKKGVKYARREDAIVHALEIENAQFAKDHPELLIVKENENFNDDDDVFKGNKNGKASKVLKNRRKTPNDEGNKRTRGLEDIGTKGSLLEVKKENGSESDIHINVSVPNGSTSSRDCSLSMKRKCSPVVNSNENSKRKKHRQPLTKVVESSAMDSVPVSCEELVSPDCLPLPELSESKVDAVINNNNLDSNGVSCKDVVNVVEVIPEEVKESESPHISVLEEYDNMSKGLFDVPLIGEEKYFLGISTACSSPRKALVSEPTRLLGDVVENEGRKGSAACTRPVTTLINGIEKSISKWQLKGKRNSRRMSQKQQQRRNANNNSLSHCSVSRHFTVGAIRNSQLYDVEIEVEASYKRRNVPLISLRSKVYREATVGHPLTVEVLDDVSSGQIVHDANLLLQIPPKKNPSHKSKSKKSSSLSKKTRCLSAISGQKLAVISKKKAKDQVVACIPMKVVFSRINEALKGSVRQVHRALPSAAGNNNT